MLIAAIAVAAATGAATAPPPRLSDTGLYADVATRTLAPGVLRYAPQYPLWTDGARKHRYVWLPPGTSIDASDPDAWAFPVGTKLWKEFAFDRPVETRLIERTASGWTYAAYLWNADGTDAVLAPEAGVPSAYAVSPGVPYDVPSRTDCRTCHEGRTTPVLGFSALQLSPDRDPRAPHATSPPPGAIDLRGLVEAGLVLGLPSELVEVPPRIEARTATERAALGYLHANCGMCHNATGPLASLGLALDYPLAAAHDAPPPAELTTFGVPSRYRPAGAVDPVRVAPGDPAHSVLARRMAARNFIARMPPLGTRVVDAEAVALVDAWILDAGELAIPVPTRTATRKENPR